MVAQDDDLVMHSATLSVRRCDVFEFAPNSRVRVLPGAYEIEIKQIGAWLPLARVNTGRGLRAFVTAGMRDHPLDRQRARVQTIDPPVDWDLLETL
jgi:hypothetical protein